MARLASAMGLSCVVGGVLIVSLFWAFGVWDVLAGTRFLDLLIRVGIVKYHDQNLGWIEGVADHKYYLASQTPVDWLLVVLAAVLFLAFFAVKAAQFDTTARHFGARASSARRARAFLYGLGLDRWLPFHIGQFGTYASLRAQGTDHASAVEVLRAMGLFVLFEICLFMLIGLLGEGWGPWVGQVAWALSVFALLYLWVRRHPGARVGSEFRAWWQEARRVIGSLAADPPVLVKVAALSFMAFALEDVAAYVIANAFGIGVEFPVIAMGLAVGYVARSIPLSPGGIGQFEWGFSVTLVLGGVGAPEAATLAILDNLLRYMVGGLVLGSVIVWYGAEARLRDVLAAFREASWEGSAT